jgi:hypothetical protein
MTHWFSSAAFLAIALAASAANAAPADVKITDAWFRSLPSSLPAGGYFTLHNESTKPVTLTGASSPDCGMLMLHKSDTMGGMMQMEDVAKLDVPAGGTLKFAPGGYHLMCMQPSAAIKPGGRTKVTLTFAGGAAAMADFAVRSATGN